MPSEEEVARHMLSHVPFRNWCEHCVKARARRRGHRRRDEEIKKQELRKVTRIYMDYYYNGVAEEEEEEVEEIEGVKKRESEGGRQPEYSCV